MAACEEETSAGKPVQPTVEHATRLDFPLLQQGSVGPAKPEVDGQAIALPPGTSNVD
jgi:hypothetical protein